MESEGRTQCNIWLVRHGESTWNEVGLIQGQTDSATLTANGIRQAQQLTGTFAEHLIGSIYSSDLLRARQTAQFLADGLQLKVTTDERLRERSFGYLEGLPQSALRVADSGFNADRVVDAQARPNGGESLDDVYRRTAAFVDMMHLRHPGGQVIVVAHGGTIRTIRAYCAGQSAADMTWDVVPNGSVWRVVTPAPASFDRPPPRQLECEGAL